MHIDLEASDSSFSSCLAGTQVCILGAGIAGLILTSELATSGIHVSLIEAGGLELEERSQNLYSAEMPESVHTGTTLGRFRTFGGSSTRWGGQLLAYPEDILHPVPGSPSAAWPLRTEDIERYYTRILEIFKIPNLPFGPELLTALGKPSFDPGPGMNLRFSKWIPFAQRNLASTLGKQILHDPKISVYTHANVSALEGAGGKIERVRILDYARREYTLSADIFIVCCGTVESSRLLLLSPDVPNPHGQIGRGFCDHVALHAAIIPAATRREVQRKLGPFFQGGVLYTPKIEATSNLQRDAGLLAVMAHFTIEEPEGTGIGSLRNLLVSLQRRQLKTALVHDLLPILQGIPDILRFAWALKVHKRRELSSRAIMRLNIDLEQDPNTNNHIALSDEKDALGLRKASVHWQINEQEYATVRKFTSIVRERLRAAGLPEFEWDDRITNGAEITLADTYHPMGGLRMGINPRESVVDTNLLVHGTQNLYVASCAVFPSGGSSNPTFTMIALTLRLADRLLSMLS